ncbi:AAA family ATPase [Candidatus Pelagibacter sp.]|nr:AAA family ATPase [Candidatus Pelagibacter sp.]
MFENIISNTSKTIVGNREKIKLTLAAIISEGSILIEDYPGSGKTTFAKAITSSLGLNFKRIQFTSDLLPSDVLGFNILFDDKLKFQKGPIFTNIVLADELNRGSPKAQSAFLEAMEEKNVTIDGESYNLPEPFFVIATQNPMDTSGTSSLPDSQLDRFMISYSLSDLDQNEKILMLKKNISFSNSVSEKINWSQINEKKNEITIKDEIYEYAVEIEQTIKALGQNIYISARCMKQMIDLAKGWAIVNGNEYVSHQDIKDTIPYILRHRIKFLNQQDKFSYVNKEILEKINIG